MERVYLIDSSIYLFRAWQRLPNQLRDADGRPAAAIYGFAHFAGQLLRGVRPQRIAFAFDEAGRSGLRNQLYPDYKANRPPTPEPLRRQFREAREFIRLLGIREAASREYEADDLIGSWAAGMRRLGHSITLITADKDLTQLIRSDDLWWDYDTLRPLDYRAVRGRFGVRPEQIADLLALIGDKSDNIPGVPGIGPRIAAKLLRRFNTLDGVIDNAEQLHTLGFRGCVQAQKALLGETEQVRLARSLTGIVTDIPLDLSCGLRPTAPDVAGLQAWFERQGFDAQRRAAWSSWIEE